MKDIVKGTTKNPLNEKEKQFIRDSHKAMTVLEMVKVLKRSGSRIYDFMDNEGLEVFRKGTGRERMKGFFKMTEIY